MCQNDNKIKKLCDVHIINTGNKIKFLLPKDIS